jgi:hypothetical protein
MEARTWLARVAGAAQGQLLSDEDIDALLDLASVAAHASERIAAPLTCWVAAAAGLTPAEALALARSLVADK